MDNFNGMDINAMRNDAMRRTKEMHKRSGHSNNSNNHRNVQASNTVPPIHTPTPEKNFSEKKADDKNNSADNKAPNTGGLLGSFMSPLFKDGKIDNEKIIIIGLIAILAKEGADLKLLIALGYILM